MVTTKSTIFRPAIKGLLLFSRTYLPSAQVSSLMTFLITFQSIGLLHKASSQASREAPGESGPNRSRTHRSKR